MWTGAILAGGRSRRLGGLNKAALHIAGAPIIDHQLAKLRQVVDHTIVIANDAEPFRDAGVPVIPDLVPASGALGALHTAVHSAPTDRTLVIACDMPFVSAALLSHLIGLGQSADIVIPRTARGYEPLCATYSRRSAGELLRLIEEKRFKLGDVALIPSLTVKEIDRGELERFGPEDVLFFNINTPDDYKRALDLSGEYRSLLG